MTLTDEQESFLSNLEKQMGILSSALQKSNITQEKYDDWYRNVEFKKRVNLINERSIDFVENQLLKKINEGDLSAIQFYLKTKGEKRGY